jgi:hypothetical protein
MFRMILRVTEIISLKCIDQSIFVMETLCVFFAVRTEILSVIYMSFVLQSLIDS